MVLMRLMAQSVSLKGMNSLINFILSKQGYLKITKFLYKWHDKQLTMQN